METLQFLVTSFQYSYSFGSLFSNQRIEQAYEITTKNRCHAITVPDQLQSYFRKKLAAQSSIGDRNLPSNDTHIATNRQEVQSLTRELMKQV